MRFRTEIVPWINEIKSYLTDSSKKIGEIKKILRAVDFSNLDYPTRARLTALFDPRCEITEEIFKRELNLYFSLLESKTSPMKIPIFSDYIDWIYSQDINRLSDLTFDLVSSRLLKTTATNLSEPINSFMSRLPAEFDKSIDVLSNSRINTLINILNETKNGYENMPVECQRFVKRMFLACAVKTEISDKNKQKFRGTFKEDPRYYYGIFNKAFAGTGEFETWIDEPAKKLTYKNMVNYANYQEQVLANVKYGLSYSNFSSCANDLNLPRLPEYDPDSMFFKDYYLKEPREYKDYAKKMGELFIGMVRTEVGKLAKAHAEGKLTQSDIEVFAVTKRIKERLNQINFYSDTKTVERKLANVFISMVHLDELTGQSVRDIYDESRPKETTETKVISPAETALINNEHKAPVANAALGDLSKVAETTKKVPKPTQKVAKTDEEEFNLGDEAGYYDLSLEDRIQNRCCIPEDLPELYELYNELMANGIHNIDLENAIFDLEVRMNEDRQDEECDYSSEKDKD